MIGSSDGKQYESDFDAHIGLPIRPPEEGENTPRKPAGKSKQTSPSEGRGEPVIDREHHVPLVASALTDDKGQMYGMAIDHRIPARPEYEKHLIKHEAYENDYMNDLVKNGMSSQDAYHKAHDWSTARESAAVTAEFGEKGLEDYKQHWRDAASIASEPTDRPRHPDAHTTRHGLDESELGKSFSDRLHEQSLKDQEALSRGASLGELVKGDTVTQELAGGFAGTFGGVGSKTFGKTAERIFRGSEGKLRQEIPDINAKITPILHAAMTKGQQITLEHVLDHPDLYKAYPELKDIKVSRDKSLQTNSAYFDPNVNKIVVGPQESMKQLRSVILHEAQHAIQEKEGFAKGSNPERMVDPVLSAYLKKFGRFPDEHTLLDTSFDAYRHVAGEVEARNVQTRADYNEYQREFIPPTSTEDIPRDKQLNAPK